MSLSPELQPEGEPIVTESNSANQDANEEDIVDIIESSTDPFIFLTGKAGSGKTASLRRFIRSTRKDVLICAPTGVAAVNCGGMTIHRMFGMQVRPFDDAYIKELSQRQKKAVKLADVLIIDEVSMLSSPMLDAIDQILRKCRRRADKPFGGLQIIAVGDLAQLPNVMKDSEWELYKNKFETPHFFSAPCFKTHPMKILNMVKIFRQSESEKDFLEILNGVRNGRLSQELLDKLNSRHRPNFTVQPGYVSLCPTNNMVDSVNSKELDKIPEVPVAYRAEVTGEFKPKDCLADELLTLKPGAQVMCLRNDVSGRYVNGTIAVVDRCDRDQIIININGEKVAIEKDLWESMQYETSQKDGVDVISQTVTGSMSQYPIKLAFAVSIHKSQGKTYDKCIVDPRGIFENGQLYVALSRCATLSGLILKNKVLQNDIRVDERVVQWVAAMRQSGNWVDVHQKFIQQSNAPIVEKIATSAESLIDRVSKGSFPTDSEIIEIAAMRPEELQEFGSKCVSVLLDEIQMRRLEIEKLKRDNASLKGKVTKYEKLGDELAEHIRKSTKNKSQKPLYRERTFAEIDFEMGMQNESEMS